MCFLGKFDNPVAIGKKGELWKNLDDEFLEIYETWRWYRIGLLKIELKDIPFNIALGLRVLCENEMSRNYYG